jgi:hypothetical protein
VIADAVFEVELLMDAGLADPRLIGVVAFG